ncbi:hypothetical protein [Nocardioides sp.]|uniref:hypothetical protein n=1 Tax=Nocardioides sp. TaxID=35761 RepID=UPI00260702E6|nr:hypothetical protein [Nocardioides sp.]
MSEQPVMTIAEKLAAARQARDTGIDNAALAADSRVKALVDKTIEDAIASGKPFSANTIRDRLPAGNHGLVGSRFRSYSMRKENGIPLMVLVGEEPSRLESTHLKNIGVWQAHAAAPASLKTD